MDFYDDSDSAETEQTKSEGFFHDDGTENEVKVDPAEIVHDFSTMQI
jgi:hypothetical protein